MLSLMTPLLMILLLAWPVAALARGGDGPNGGGGMRGDGGGVGLSSRTTKKLVKTLTQGFEGCQRIRDVYRYDCYRQTYKRAANQIVGNPSYGDAFKALVAVEATLDRILAEESDPATPPVRKGFQVYRPIKASALPTAKADLTRALNEAETVLLRSDDRAGFHYARIAEAINSNKVLLRSALLWRPLQNPMRSAFA